MKKLLFSLLALWLWCPAPAQRKYALIIGNSDYSTGNLKNPVHDAEHVADILKKAGFGVSLGKNLDKDKMTRYIDSFFTRISAVPCVALFYYSGHGIQSDGENYMIPIGAAIPGKPYVDPECIKVDHVLKIMEDSKSFINFVVLDACRADPFSSHWTRGPGEKGLTILQNPHNSFVMYSTSPGTVALDGTGDNSPFTDALCQYMQVPGMDIEGIFRNVKNKITSRYPQQIPWSATTLGDEFIFVRDTSTKGRVIRSQAPIHFYCSAPCQIVVNGDTAGTVTDAQSFVPYIVRSGNNNIVAISASYPDIQYSFDLDLNDADIQDNMRQYIPMAEIVRNLRVTPVLNTLRFADWATVEGGDYYMGDRNGHSDETPQHRVHLSSFAIKRHEVTQQEWKAIMGTSPSSRHDCPQCPVENISWNDIDSFLLKLNTETGEHYRLPTEAEWEFAARGGNLTWNAGDQFSGGGKLEKLAWFKDNAGGQSQQIGKKEANALGLFDMNGNVAEWCSDWYDANYYRSNDSENPAGPAKGKDKVVRGGAWSDFDVNCRVFSRDKQPVNHKDKTIGFRLAIDTRN